MKTHKDFWSYLAQFFLEWETFQTNVEKINTHILYSITFFRKSCLLWDNVEKQVNHKRRSASLEIHHSLTSLTIDPTQYSQCAYDVTLWRVRATTVAVEKQ